MTEIAGNLTPLQIVQTLTNIGKSIDDLGPQIEELDEAEIRAKAAYDSKYRNTFLRTEGAMDLRKVVAEDAASAEALEYQLAGVRLRAAKERLWMLRDRMKIGQSLGALLRTEWGAS